MLEIEEVEELIGNASCLYNDFFGEVYAGRWDLTDEFSLIVSEASNGGATLSKWVPDGFKYSDDKGECDMIIVSYINDKNELTRWLDAVGVEYSTQPEEV